MTELCTVGELFDKIMQRKHFTEEEALVIMRQVLSAIIFCHQHGIVHRDLKPENILFVSKKKDSQIRVIDFGTSAELGPQLLNERVGTVK